MKLIFAVDHTTRSGRTYKSGSTHNINNADARVLIHQGVARPVEEDTEPESTPTPKPVASTDKK